MKTFRRSPLLLETALTLGKLGSRKKNKRPEALFWKRFCSPNCVSGLVQMMPPFCERLSGFYATRPPRATPVGVFQPSPFAFRRSSSTEATPKGTSSRSPRPAFPLCTDKSATLQHIQVERKTLTLELVIQTLPPSETLPRGMQSNHMIFIKAQSCLFISQTAGLCCHNRLFFQAATPKTVM